MYGILGEDSSDVEALKCLVHRIAGNSSITIKTRGYDGCGQLLRKGASQIQLFSRPPYSFRKFIVCYDCDRANPKERHDDVVTQIVKPSAVAGLFCVIVPVQELEAWILADIAAVENIFDGWSPKEILNPEAVNDPKQHLEKLSRDSKQRPKYVHAVHNPRIAKFLNLDTVAKKCKSFHPLLDFILHGKANA